MITIGKQRYVSRKEDFSIIKDRLADLTAKSNLNPDLLFRLPYFESTSKKFIGNWTNDGFWIAKCKRGFLHFNSSVVAKANIVDNGAHGFIDMKFSLSLSTIFEGFIIICLFTALLTAIIFPFFISAFIVICLHGLLLFAEKNSFRKFVERHIIFGLNDK